MKKAFLTILISALCIVANAQAKDTSGLIERLNRIAYTAQAPQWQRPKGLVIHFLNDSTVTVLKVPYGQLPQLARLMDTLLRSHGIQSSVETSTKKSFGQ